MSAGLARRTRILVLAAEGHSNTEIGRRVGVNLPTVRMWQERYLAWGSEQLEDLPRSGRPAVHDEAVIIAATLEPPPEKLGVTHWSARLLANHLGISFATVARIWRRWGLKPWKAETFKFSTDRELEAKIRDVVGLYLAPPAKAVVVCISREHEKTQIQALDRTMTRLPILPLRPGIPERQTHDYKPNGTTTLFAALEVATGLVTDRRFQQHTNKEFLTFLKQVARAYPRVQLRSSSASCATTTPPTSTPTSRPGWPSTPGSTCTSPRPRDRGSDMVEIFFGIITRQAICRGTFHSVADLETAIGTYIDGWNERAHPFTWTKIADEIISHAEPSPHPKRIYNTRH